MAVDLSGRDNCNGSFGWFSAYIACGYIAALAPVAPVAAIGGFNQTARPPTSAHLLPPTYFRPPIQQLLSLANRKWVASSSSCLCFKSIQVRIWRDLIFSSHFNLRILLPGWLTVLPEWSSVHHASCHVAHGLFQELSSFEYAALSDRSAVRDAVETTVGKTTISPRVGRGILWKYFSSETTRGSVYSATLAALDVLIRQLWIIEYGGSFRGSVVRGNVKRALLKASQLQSEPTKNYE